ncbi:DUF1015 domain-containing protein [Nocardioides anomalus]|uniref:DUF1015 domain-containing protein n=1 Tax=Nocardioides anomalus TaxID=2712223 RepID=A0A6G6WB57_9ACTN|nr:DUF1015 family protein [Nocardioides anomalus]QIG42383.1 DUF1015 domain-containing protein [Nocardioides anomalus]
MSVVRPFAARVVRPEYARRLVSGLAELPEDTGTLPPVAPPDPAAYDLVEEALYVYRQGEHVGVVAEVDVRAFTDGRVRGHEAVQAQRVESLVAHLRTDAPPALVALLHPAGPAYERAVVASLEAPPLLDFDGPGGLRQTVWRVAPELTAELAAELSGATHYIADGHHRVAASLTAWHRAGEPDGSGVLCVVHPMDGLDLSAFHRRVLGPVDAEPLAALLATSVVQPVAAAPEPRAGSVGLYAGGRWSLVTLPPADGALDVEVLQAEVLDRLARPVEIAHAQTPVEELTRRCDADGGVLFTLAPPPLGALVALADRSGTVPPKTTYFEPKPCAGVFRRPF